MWFLPLAGIALVLVIASGVRSNWRTNADMADEKKKK